ncbi:myosin-8-like isoform X2 [Hemibagrus wyckioides]|uniref:myosin-8-like isoform X2 n=1 Tax=Hemibagrus wyckioides TaxID=337641 RepID=UPI00266B49D8|nr:myosin-8-like isoform X2 [Hemibagrus wyckioides]
MLHLMSLFRFRMADLPVRPLLFAAGAAATATGVYYWMKKRGNGEKTEELPDTALTEDSASVESDEDDVRVPESDRAVHPEVSLVEAEEEIQKDEVVSAPVDSERSDLKDGVREQEERLREAHRECECKSKVSLAETEEKNELVVVSCAQLKREKAGLMSEVTKLQGSVKELKKELFKIGLEHDGLAMECKMKCMAIASLEAQHKAMKSSTRKEYEEVWQAHSELEKQCKQLKKTLTDKQVSLANAEAKYQNLVRSDNNMVLQVKECILEVYQSKKQMQDRDIEAIQSSFVELLKQQTDLIIQCNQLRQAHSDLKSKFTQMKETLNMPLNEQEQSQAHRNQKAEHTAMMETLKQCFELLKNHLEDVEC